MQRAWFVQAPAHMTQAIPAFVNPAAGSAPEAIERLRADDRFAIHEVDGDALPAAVRAAVDARTRRILVSGGDGTIASAANALLGSKCELAVLPGGTLNHFARDLGLPRDDLEQCIEIAATGVARPTDIGTVNGRIFLNTSSLGVYIAFVRLRERLEPYVGYRIATLIAALRTWTGLHGFDVQVADGDTVRWHHTPLLYVGVGERELDRRELGAKVPDGPRALHLFVLRETTRARLLARAIAALANGTRSLAASDSLDVRLVPEFTVHLRQGSCTAAVDGELIRLSPPLEYRFVPDALRVVVPDIGHPSRPRP